MDDVEAYGVFELFRLAFLFLLTIVKTNVEARVNFKIIVCEYELSLRLDRHTKSCEDIYDVRKGNEPETIIKGSVLIEVFFFNTLSLIKQNKHHLLTADQSYHIPLKTLKGEHQKERYVDTSLELDSTEIS